VELWSPYPGRYRELSAPAFTPAINGEASPVIAFYPLVGSDDAYYYEQLLWSLYLPPSSRLVNGAPVGSPEDDVRQQLLSLNSAQTWADLEALGVDYVVIDTAAYAERNGRPVGEFFGDVLYADQKYVVVKLNHGGSMSGWLEGDMYPAEVREVGASWRWLRDDTSVVIRSEIAGCALIEGSAASPDQDADFAISQDQPSQPRLIQPDDGGNFSFAVPVTSGETRVKLRPDRSSAKLSTDDRVASLYMSDVSVHATDAAGCSGG
jgi:hypothetical protein